MYESGEIEVDDEYVAPQKIKYEEEEESSSDEKPEKFQFQHTEKDYNWLLSTFSNLCKMANKPEMFDEINKELRERRFIPADFQNSTLPEHSCIASPFSQAYTMIDYIGQGGYGKIMKVQNLIDKQFYALKIIKVSKEDISVAVREVQCLAALRSPRIVRYFSSWLETSTDESHTSLFIQMEYLSGLTLCDYISLNKPLPLATKKALFYQIILALSEIHSAGIIHRDFSPSNIIVQNDGRIVVIDFGIASIKNSSVPPRQNYKEQMIGKQPRVGSLTLRPIDQFVLNEVGKDTKTQRTVGTKLYSSPKQLSGHKSNSTDDIYSLGIIAYELYSDFQTYQEKTNSINKLRLQQKVDSDFSTKYPEITEIVVNCIQNDSRMRPTAYQILTSAYFSDCKDLYK